MKRVADVYAQLSSLRHRALLSDAERKAEYLRLQRKLDELLAQGYDRDSARHFVADEMTEILSHWGVRRPLSEEEL